MILTTLTKEAEKLTKQPTVQGTVVDNADPLGKSRVRVLVDNWNPEEDIPLEYMPWYIVIGPPTNSSVSPPPIGTRVSLQILDNYNAYVLGAISSTAAS